MVNALCNSVRLVRRAVRGKILKALRRFRPEPTDVCRLDGRNVRIEIVGAVRSRERVKIFQKIKELLKGESRVAVEDFPLKVRIELSEHGKLFHARAYLLYGRKLSFPIPGKSIPACSLSQKEAIAFALARVLEGYALSLKKFDNLSA